MKITTKDQLDWLIHDMSLPNAQTRCCLDNIEIDFNTLSTFLGASFYERVWNIQAFCKALKNYPAKHIVLANQSTWDDDTFVNVLNAINDNTTVTHVNLANNPQMTSSCVTMIDRLLAREQIKVIDLSGCGNITSFCGSGHAHKIKALEAAPSSSMSSTSTTTSSGSASPSAPVATADMFYGVSNEKTGYSGGYLENDDAYKVFAKSTRFKAFNDVNLAHNYRAEQTKRGWFDEALLPGIYNIVMKNSVQGYHEAIVEKHHIAAVSYCRTLSYLRNTSSCLFHSDEQEKILRSIIYTALAKYRRATEMTTTSSDSAADAGGVCSTMGSSDARASGASRHSSAGVDRAESFYDSLFELDFYSLMPAITKYINRPFTGNYDRDKSFKAILYVELLNHYGTSGLQRHDRDQTPEIRKEDLIDILDTAKKAIETRVLAEVSAAQVPKFC